MRPLPPVASPPAAQAFTSEGKEVWETHLQSQIHTVRAE